ncbi:MAG: cupin domain-containing protein [Ferruginibacter sp.]|nr:cupin domain-containing protein [Ferruginibacter sp.]
MKKLNFFYTILIVLASSDFANAQSASLNQFGAVWQDSIQWKSFSSFPKNVKLALLVGDPKGNEPFLVRVKVPSNEKIMPHKHPETRIYTVISGIFYIGIGNTYDEGKLKAYPPGTVIVLPGNTPHFHWAKSGEYVSQVYAIGPLGLEYIDKKDAPKH